jgi:RimJ/RimL family protein N-acetyltransferase
MKYIRKLLGENCYLSPINPDDAERIAVWSNDFEMSLFTGDISDMISINKQRGYLEYMSNNGYAFAIVAKANNEPIGICKLTQVDLINKKATLGIFIGEKHYWNKGYGTEATKLIIDFGFNILNLRNIMLIVYSFNERAIRSYEKCGFKEIGRRRNSIIFGTKEYDEIYMDILSEKFEGSIVNKILK